MNDMLENKMLLETAADPKEQDPDEAYEADRAALSDNDYANLNAELVAITRLQAITSDIEKLIQSIQGSLFGRRIE